MTITTIDDLRQLAKRRVPRMFYDYADAGSWTESTYRANSDDFMKILFRQRVAVNLADRTLRLDHGRTGGGDAGGPGADRPDRHAARRRRDPRRARPNALACRSHCRP
ncbi:alpha-hydroxy-acid oxidizing protein [Massilia sp. B-10]|nr:alpha-hydroxy-acid oxidizing protein [Massilia sp. B-10]